MTPEDQQHLESISICIFPTGSRIICQPPVLNTDEDWYVLVENYSKFDALLDMDYTSPEKSKEEYPEMDGDDFKTYRKDEINLIVTEDRKFFLDGYLATCLCQGINAFHKDLRINIFQHFRCCPLKFALDTWKEEYIIQDRPRYYEKRYKQPSFEPIDPNDYTLADLT